VSAVAAGRLQVRLEIRGAAGPLPCGTVHPLGQRIETAADTGLPTSIVANLQQTINEGSRKLVNLCADALGGRYSGCHGRGTSLVELELLEGTYARRHLHLGMGAHSGQEVSIELT
jgi:hypothetical protein